MKRRAQFVLLIGLAGVVCWFVWQRWQTYDYANFPSRNAGPWVAFGDSLTEGYGASEGHDYPSVLGQRLGLKIVNLGRSGETSAEGLARAGEVAQLKPRVVLLCFGGNDGLQRLSREQMFNNVALMIDRFQEEGSFVVLIGVRSASLRDQNAKGFRALAKEKKVFYVRDILKGIFLKPVYMSDAVHPNEEGYRRMAERLEKELRSLLKKLQSPLMENARS